MVFRFRDGTRLLTTDHEVKQGQSVRWVFLTQKDSRTQSRVFDRNVGSRQKQKVKFKTLKGQTEVGIHRTIAKVSADDRTIFCKWWHDRILSSHFFHIGLGYFGFQIEKKRISLLKVNWRCKGSSNFFRKSKKFLYPSDSDSPGSHEMSWSESFEIGQTQ